MINKELRQAIENYACANEEEIVLLDNPSFDKSIIGITTDNRLIYDYESMINELSEEDDIDLLDAEEFIQYNTLRALPYFQTENAPLILQYKNKHILDLYGYNSDTERSVINERKKKYANTK